MRALALLSLLALLPGCEFALTAAPPLWGAELASIMVFQRGLIDLAYSGATGRDCSVVRLDQGRSYCREPDPPLAAPTFCTRSLANVDCWANPDALPAATRQVADGPRTLTRLQEAERTRRWPNL